MPDVAQNEENESSTHPCGKWKGGGGTGCSAGVYGLAFIGAVVYYIQEADTFWMGVLGVLKALVWPALLTYNLLGFLGM